MRKNSKPFIYIFFGQWRCTYKGKLGIGCSPVDAYLNFASLTNK